jgi:hypothetical protein
MLVGHVLILVVFSLYIYAALMCAVGIKGVQKAITDLELSLVHLQQNIDIPDITLVINPVVKQISEQVLHLSRRCRSMAFFLPSTLIHF